MNKFNWLKAIEEVPYLFKSKRAQPKESGVIMKKAIIIHCWNGSPEYYWYPYVKRELEDRGFAVATPFLPDMFPLLSKWLARIKLAVGIPDEDTYFIGHSLGSVALLKYLQGLPEGQKVGGVVLLAPFVDDLNFRFLRNFFVEPLNYELIKSKSPGFIVISSFNDPYIKLYHSEILKTNLNADVIWTNKGHFTEYGDKSKCFYLPEVITAIEKLSKSYLKDNYEKSIHNRSCQASWQSA